MEKLTKYQRHEKRREIIIEAAKKCVAEKGFHAASVAMIANEAKINVGQMYRYFNSKESIVEAISEQVFEKNVKKMKKGGQFANIFICDTEDTKTMSEIHSEANRNSAVDRIMIRAEKKMSEYIINEMKKLDPKLNDKDAEEAESMLMILTGGLFLFSLRKKNMPKNKMLKLSEYMFKKLFPNLSKK